MATLLYSWKNTGFPGSLMVKTAPANAGDAGSIHPSILA